MRGFGKKGTNRMGAFYFFAPLFPKKYEKALKTHGKKGNGYYYQLHFSLNWLACEPSS
jgi:hypothetical protein